LKKRYRVIKVIGQGVFGVVVKAYDQQQSKHVAIKVVKDNSDCK
jgi:serine/threonine protein kinase